MQLLTGLSPAQKASEYTYVDVGFQGHTFIPVEWGYGMHLNRGFFTMNKKTTWFDDGLCPMGWFTLKNNHIVVVLKEINLFEDIPPVFTCLT
jgi:hypothetical protein